MNSAIERLLTLRVRDVMRRHVIAVNVNDSMATAAESFEAHDITGAPVLDEGGTCVGVLSSSDFVYLERTRSAPAEGPIQIRGPAEPTETGSDSVRDFMSPIVRTIAEEAPILNAARVMCEEHIHRLVVVDGANQPAGILTSLDLVACMVVAVEE